VQLYHSWANKEVANLAYPFFTCEAVISETCFLLRDFYGGEDTIMSLLDTGLIQISFRLSDEIRTVRELLNRYQNVPMFLTDACLVRISELISGSSVLTLDSDFRVYRKNKNEIVDVIIADEI
jgi:predicted nucleic acid-binding protein